MELILKLKTTLQKENYSTKFLFPLLGLILIATVFHFWSGESFLTSRNLSNLSRQISVQTVLSVGMTLVIITSGIDLSIGSVLALAGMVTAISQVHWGFSNLGIMGAFLSILISLAVGASTGLFTGFAVSRLHITPFIVTLGMMVICRGFTLVFSGAQAVAPLGTTLEALSSSYLSPNASFFVLTSLLIIYSVTQVFSARFLNVFIAILFYSVFSYVFCGYRGIPYLFFIAVIIAYAGYWILQNTRYGRFLYAIGGNREAAELSGVPVQKTLWVTYLIMGVLAALAGVMDTTRVNGAVPSAGELSELDAIAAVVIGGTSLMGGQGGILGTLFGVLIMGVLNNGMSLVGISEHYQKIFKGIVIILAVYLDMRGKKK
jgi:D-xylose transport system permease protein